MRCEPCNPQALLLVKGTGSGKLPLAQTVDIVDGCVTLIIVETPTPITLPWLAPDDIITQYCILCGFDGHFIIFC